MSFWPMLTKELKELVRSYKLVFVPLVFAILAVGQPLAYKMMPLLLKSASNLPEGAVIEIPAPKVGEIVVGIIGQLNQMGILLLVLVVMGAIAGERNSGVAATVLTKPVSRAAYILAKATAFSLLAALSLSAAMLLGAYYTQVLFEPVDWAAVVSATLLYLPNLLLAVVLTLGLSAFMPSPLSAGGLGLVALILLNTVPRYMGRFLAGSYPGALTESAARALLGVADPVAQPLAGVLVLIAACLAGGWLMLRRQEI